MARSIAWPTVSDQPVDGGEGDGEQRGPEVVGAAAEAEGEPERQGPGDALHAEEEHHDEDRRPARRRSDASCARPG